MYVYTLITLKQLRTFLGPVHLYRDMWKHHSCILTPLIDLVGKCMKKIEWNNSHQNAFEDIIKKVMAKETILNYTKFEEPFEIHTDVSSRYFYLVNA